MKAPRLKQLATAAAIVFLLHGLGGTSTAVAAPAARYDVPMPFSAHVVAESRMVASIAMSPDERFLYGSTLMGDLLRWPRDVGTGALGEAQTLSLDLFREDGQGRALIGLAFDPERPDVLWVADNAPVALQGSFPEVPDFSGRIARVFLEPGDAFAGRAEVYLRGLPRSCSDHLTNSLAFRSSPAPEQGGPSSLLYVSQGSNSAMGEADYTWCFRPERLLSAAVLEVDPRRAPPAGGFDVTTEPLPADGENRRFGYDFVLRSLIWPGDDGDLKNGGIAIDAGPYDGNYLHFAPDGVASVRVGVGVESPVVASFYDPFAPDAVLRIFATGVRNAYDIVWHSNGQMYLPTNGSAAGGRVPDNPATPVAEATNKVGREPDRLFRMVEGSYGGHPNPLRDEFVAYGGNPTVEPDQHEVSKYEVGVMPEPTFESARVYDLGHHFSPNGAIEYRGPAFQGRLDGAVMFVNFSQGDDVRVIVPAEDGAPAADFRLSGPDGQPITQTDPLDIVQDSAGRLYVSTLERSNGFTVILRLDPEEPAL